MTDGMTLRSGRMTKLTDVASLTAELDAAKRRIGELEAALASATSAKATAAASRADLLKKYASKSYNPITREGLQAFSECARELKWKMADNDPPIELPPVQKKARRYGEPSSEWYHQISVDGEDIDTPMARRVIADCCPTAIIDINARGNSYIYIPCDELGMSDAMDWDLLRVLEDSRLPWYERDEYGLVYDYGDD
jgi:hypothetical protein